MIKLRLDIFITLVVKLCSVSAEALYYPEKPILRGGNSEVSDILLRGNENPDIFTVLSDDPKPIFGIGNPAVATTHRDNSKPVAGGNPKAVIPIGNPALADILRDNLKDILRGGNPEISAMLRANPKPFAAISEIPAMSRDEPKHNLLAVIPELFAMPHDNQKTNLYGGVRELLRKYTKPLLSNRAAIRVRKDSESDSHLFLKSDNNKYIIKDYDLKEALYRMIDMVTNVNDERILSLNQFFELENYLPQMSRTSKQKNPLIAFITNTPNYKSKNNLNINHLTEDPRCEIFKKKHTQPRVPNILKEIIFNYNEGDDEVNIPQESDETSFTKDYLRAWKSCNKSASKNCQKACRKAINTVCNDYRCSTSFKNRIKKQCKKRCEEKFNNARKLANVGQFTYLGKPGTVGTYYNQII